jgi:hypothetical protein
VADGALLDSNEGPMDYESSNCHEFATSDDTTWRKVSPTFVSHLPHIRAAAARGGIMR